MDTLLTILLLLAVPAVIIVMLLRWRAFRRWAGYKLNFTTICSLLLIFFVLLAFVMGAQIGWRKGGGYWKEISVWGEAILCGIHTVLGILDASVDELRNEYPNFTGVTWMLSVVIPLLTVSTMLSVIIDFMPLPLWPKGEYLIFSEVEEYSILLAESMMQNQTEGQNIRRKVIFLRAEKEKMSPENADRLKRIKATLYPYTESDLLRIHWLIRRSYVRFFFLSTDTDCNFSRMQLFVEDVEKDYLFSPPLFKKSREAILKKEQNGIFRQELYLLSETESAPLLIDNLRRTLCVCEKSELCNRVNDKLCVCKDRKLKRKDVFAHTDLRLLDRYRTVMYDLLCKKPLYEKTDHQQNRVLILGFGKVGQAFFRGAVSFSAMAGYNTSFWVRDDQVDQQWNEMLSEYPQCRKGVLVDKECMKVQTEALLRLIDDHLSRSEPFTYILVSLGDDERNIKIASKLARHYRQRYWETPSDRMPHRPVICVNVENAIKADYVSELFGEPDKDVELYVFGTDKKTFREEVMINRSLWSAARQFHEKRFHKNQKEDKCDFVYWTEYERRSSVACAAHASYHVKSMELYSGETDYDIAYTGLTDAQKWVLIDAEHRRWMHYSRCEGMRGIDQDMAKKIMDQTSNHVDTIARLTPCMVATDALPELYESLYPGTDKINEKRRQEGLEPYRSFLEKDRLVVSNAGRLHKIVKGDEKIELKDFE